MQNFQTHDGNVRLTLRPVQNVVLVSRYEYQYSTLNTAPDSVSGLGNVQSSTMTSQIFAQNVSWSPWSRLSLQAGFNYVVSETKTPASAITQAELNSQNNYWTVTFDSSVVVTTRPISTSALSITRRTITTTIPASACHSVPGG